MGETVAIIDYGSGNLHSAAKGLERAASDAGLDVAVAVTADADVVNSADRVVLPGVGAFADCLAGVTALDGMAEALEEAVIARGRPFFGICVGMQLLFERGLEHGEHEGFGWLAGDVAEIVPDDPALKIPHMGWNTLALTEAGSTHPLFAGWQPGDHAYFVHSYAPTGARPDDVLATADHGGAFTAVVGRDNIFATQFHPEKSQRVGLGLFRRFLEWRP
ncbi:MAG: imidazole glycerol phosphate synthase subunit HisH [Sphingomonadales bacterium]|nr:imidazole glycerol phosphate synthase subunit HisH [Sphingomonadales bacterium]